MMLQPKPIKRKVLIITYYWPPSAGAGVQRWLKFAKYLPQFGWEPIIYTPSNPEPPEIDTSLLNDVPDNLKIIKKPVWEPYALYKRLTGKDKTGKITHGFLKEKANASMFEHLSVWIRGNLFIPDARCFWIKPSVRYLTEYLSAQPVDAIVSTGPPHSMHLIALGVKKRLNIPWLADFRDPWTEIDYYHKLKLTHLANRKHRRLEKAVLTSADSVLTIGDNLAQSLYRVSKRNITVISNGFDPDDFDFLPVRPEDSFTLTHIGSLNSDRNPDALWRAIAKLCLEHEPINHNLRLRFVGKTDISLKESLSRFGLLNRAAFTPYLPHTEAIKIAASSAALLLLINRTPNHDVIVTGKVFEYLASGRPILCIGPENGESAKIIKQCQAGKVCEYDDEVSMVQAIKELFNNFENGKNNANQYSIEQYSRKNLTERLSELLNRITSN